MSWRFTCKLALLRILITSSSKTRTQSICRCELGKEVLDCAIDTHGIAKVDSGNKFHSNGSHFKNQSRAN